MIQLHPELTEKEKEEKPAAKLSNFFVPVTSVVPPIGGSSQYV